MYRRILRKLITNEVPIKLPRDYFSIGKRLQEPVKSAKYARLSMQTCDLDTEN